MKRTLLSAVALVLLASLAPVAAQDDAEATQWRDVDIEKLIENAPGKDEYPEASALFLYLQEMTDVDAGGAVVSMRNKLTHVLTLQGRERYSNPSFQYDTDTETVELARGVTIRESGREVEVEEDGINDITPAFLEGATIYANVLEKVISFPVAGPGSTMDLQTLHTRSPASDRSFSGVEYMGDTDPLLEAEFTLTYPAAEYDPTYKIDSGHLGDVEINESVSDGRMVFGTSDVPALVPEEWMPPKSEILPRILYSSYQDWNEPAAFFADAFYPHVRTDGVVAEKAAELTADASTEADMIEAIFLDVAKNIRNVYLSLGIGGYEPNDAATVLENKYADTRDKAVLLVSMLRAAGIDAYPAAVRQKRGSFEMSVPTLRQFDRLLVAVPSDGGYDFLDPFLDNARYGYLRWGRGNTALVVKDDGSGELVEIPAFEPDDNRSERRMAISVAPDGSATVQASCGLEGYFDRVARMRLKDATKSEKDKTFEGSANAVSPGARSVSYDHSDLADLTEPVTVSQKVDAPDFAVPQGDMMIVRVPGFPFDFAALGAYPSLAERKYPFELPCEAGTTISVEIELPDTYDVVRMPEDRTVSTDAADWRLSTEWDASTHTITWTLDATFSDMLVPVGSYGEYKRAFDSIAHPKNSLILLARS
ncbi:MAG: DUF3857 domain-containing protein [Candidatus Eisenbacteria bacterium]|nr:DUF3857 domain-containing protein [Candidatus Eisenbacteria bacterium]